MVREIRGVLALGPVTDWKVPILKTEAGEGKGVEELAAAIDAHHEHIKQAGTLEERRGGICATRCSGLPPCACDDSWSARWKAIPACRSSSSGSCGGSRPASAAEELLRRRA